MHGSKFSIFFYKDNGEQKGTPESDGRYYFYLSKSDIEKLESVIGAIFHKEVKIQLYFGNVFNEALGDDFNLYIYYDNSGTPEYLNIYVNDALLCRIIYADVNYYSYEDFSIVSDELK